MSQRGIDLVGENPNLVRFLTGVSRSVRRLRMKYPESSETVFPLGSGSVGLEE